jgi:multidrug efflux pump subunit AcrA (membrane-fusion protein)
MSSHSHKKPFYRKPLFIFLAILLIGGAIFAATNLGRGSAQASLSPYTVAKETLTKTVSGSGKLEAADQRKIGGSQGSTIKEMNVEIGSQVIAGQVLAVETQGGQTGNITSPIDGTVMSIGYKQGENIGQNEVFVVANLSNMKTTISASEFDINSIAKDQKVKVKIKSLSADKEFEGLVKNVAAISDSSSSNGTYQVQISLNEKPLNAKIGMATTSIITAEKKENVLAVPVERVFKQGDSYFVREVDWINKDQNIYSLKNIKITKGLETDDKVEILTGLNEGDTLALETDKPAQI